MTMVTDTDIRQRFQRIEELHERFMAQIEHYRSGERYGKNKKEINFEILKALADTAVMVIRDDDEALAHFMNAINAVGALRQLETKNKPK